MTRTALALTALFAALLIAGCRHDLGQLRAHPDAAEGGSEPPEVPEIDAGEGTGAGLRSCEPCAAPPGFSDLGMAEACCTGLKDAQCGVSIVSGGRCFARDVPSVPEPSCPDVMRLGAKFPGCCRFDGQCGVKVDPLDLSCMGRDEVPAALGGPLAPRACTPKCDKDQTCSSLVDLAVCVEDATHRADARYCGLTCKNDKDCGSISGTVCAIQGNNTDMRLDVVCRKPFGAGELGATCAVADDCVHGICLDSMPRFCSQFCRTDLDCPGVGNQCKSALVRLPAPATGTQTLSVCLPRK